MVKFVNVSRFARLIAGLPTVILPAANANPPNAMIAIVRAASVKENVFVIVLIY